jgi:pimeloyl-ACP methyl ester carboxylesterase
MFARNLGIAFAWIALAMTPLVGGCALTPSMTPGQISAVQPASDMPRAGNVYLLRGWIGIFSYGIDNLTQKLNAAGIRAHQYQDDQADALAAAIIAKYKTDADHEPLVLIGHSYGADDAIRIARLLEPEHIRVDLIITLDPVTPPQVPGNVTRCYNLYETNGWRDTLPWMRGIPLQLAAGSHCNLQNVDIRKDRKDLVEGDLDHFNIEKKPAIHAECIKQVDTICPPRAQWAAAHAPAVAREAALASAAAKQRRAVMTTSSRHLKATGDSIRLNKVSDQRMAAGSIEP